MFLFVAKWLPCSLSSSSDLKLGYQGILNRMHSGGYPFYTHLTAQCTIMLVNECMCMLMLATWQQEPFSKGSGHILCSIVTCLQQPISISTTKIYVQWFAQWTTGHICGMGRLWLFILTVRWPNLLLTNGGQGMHVWTTSWEKWHGHVLTKL